MFSLYFRRIFKISINLKLELRKIVQRVFSATILYKNHSIYKIVCAILQQYKILNFIINIIFRIVNLVLSLISLLFILKYRITHLRKFYPLYPNNLISLQVRIKNVLL